MIQINKTNIKNRLFDIEKAISKMQLKIYEKKALSVFMFHRIFKNKKEIELDIIERGQKVTVENFRQFIEYYLENGYTFISPKDILDGFAKEGKYALITFDDGYFNNINVLPLLNEYNIPAIFFIATDFVEQNKCFWSDVLHRNRIKEGISLKKIREEKIFLKHKKQFEIEQYLIKNFGTNALLPISDLDRPFTINELKKFSQNSNVYIGNHTTNHAILTNYPLSEVKSQIEEAQKKIENITSTKPYCIAYPNGNFSNDVIDICKQIGLKIGFTTIKKKNRLPINNLFTLNRFSIHGTDEFYNNCMLARSDVRFMPYIIDKYSKLI